jgi:hypothetical protein
MSKQILVYWYGIIGIAGKGPNYSESYNPNRTIGDIIQAMIANKLGENGKKIEMLKFQNGNMNKYDINDMYWNHDMKLSEYLNILGGWNGSNYLMLVYVIV